MAVVRSSFDSADVANDWERVYDGYVELTADPGELIGQLGVHLARAGEAIVSGDKPLTLGITLLALAGLGWEAWRGSRSVAARFVLALPAIAFAGSLETGAVRLTSGSSGPAPQGCEALRRPVRAAPDSRVELYARTSAPEVRVRRFGPDWVAIGRVQEGRVATLALPGYASGEAWELSATEGVCVSVMPA